MGCLPSTSLILERIKALKSIPSAASGMKWSMPSNEVESEGWIIFNQNKRDRKVLDSSPHPSQPIEHTENNMKQVYIWDEQLKLNEWLFMLNDYYQFSLRRVINFTLMIEMGKRTLNYLSQ